MSDEIKEILEDVKRHLDYVEATKQASIRDNEMKAMYDYITNLQKENDRLNNIIEELESFLYDQKEIFRDANIKLFVAMVLDKLKELKENNNAKDKR